MFKWVLAVILSFIPPFIGVPWLLYLIHKATQEARDEKQFAGLRRSMGMEEQSDFSSKEVFQSEINSQLDGFENKWRAGSLFQNSHFHPTFTSHNGINWSKETYLAKCKQVHRKPIPEILEDFDLELERSHKYVEQQISSFSKFVEDAASDIKARLESGDGRRRILDAYNDPTSHGFKKLVSVSCEHSVWKINATHNLLALNPRYKQLILEKLEDCQDQLLKSFVWPDN